MNAASGAKAVLIIPALDEEPAIGLTLRRIPQGLYQEIIVADVTESARAAFPEAGLGDFLRVFLDIRLPFVAFGGSIIGVFRTLSHHWIRAGAGQA